MRTLAPAGISNRDKELHPKVNCGIWLLIPACFWHQSHHITNMVTLTHWGWATHICVSKLTIIASDNGLSPGRRQAIIWNNAGILSIGLLGTNFSEILIEILTFSFKKMRLKVSSAKWRPFCLGLNVLSQLECVCVFQTPWSIFFYQTREFYPYGSHVLENKPTWIT